MSRFVRYIGKSPIIIEDLTLDSGQLVNLDNLSDEAQRIIEKERKEFIEIPKNGISLVEELKHLLQNHKLAFNYAEIRGAIIKRSRIEGQTLATTRNIWDAYLIKITLGRKNKSEQIGTPLETLLKRPNFLVFMKCVDLKSVKAIVETVVNVERFDLDEYTIRCKTGHFAEDYFCRSSWGRRFGLSWASKLYSYTVKEKPRRPEKLALKIEGFQDFNHAIRELLQISPFEHGSFSDKSIILVLPYYLAKISRCEIQEKRLIVDIERHDEGTTLEDLRCWYYYRRLPTSSDWLSESEEKEVRGEISPLKWHNKVELSFIPDLVDVSLIHDGFEEPIDECHVYKETKVLPRKFDIHIELPELFGELKSVLEKAGFDDADGKIVLAAATNLLEVVVVKKLQDLGANIKGSLNEKTKRVIEEIREKEHRKIDRQLISPLLKVARDKLDHEGFRLIVSNIDAGFLLKRTIDFMQQLYP